MRKPLAAIALAAPVMVACSDMPLDVGATSLVSVVPSAGSADVPLDAPIEVRFDGPVAVNGVYPIALQLGDCPGPVVMGTWARTADGMGLTFTPAMPLMASTRYTIHIGGGVPDTEGTAMNLRRDGPQFGGMWVSEAMAMGMTSMGMVSHATDEWRDPYGTFGLAFDFTTGS